MYALVEIKGKQYKAVEGKTLQVDLFSPPVADSLDPSGADMKVECDKVMLLSDGEKSRVGQPYIEGASVTLRLGEEVKGKKLRIVKYKKRKKYRRAQGHRQRYSLVTVAGIKGEL